MRLSAFTILAGGLAAPAVAGTVTITVPKLTVAEYHKPYVAIWLEPTGGGAARTVAVWYEVKKTGNEPGTKWLADLRTWWRKAGRTMKMPADGVSGATRAPGQHKIVLPANVKPGAYTLHVEAARETGGRELLSVPVTIPKTSGRASGKTELGAILVTP